MAFLPTLASGLTALLSPRIRQWQPPLGNHGQSQTRRRLLGDTILLIGMFTPARKAAATSTLSRPTTSPASPSKEEPIIVEDHWKTPKKYGLNTERMADAINDGIKETEWPVTGNGRPELFSDNFVFVNSSGQEVKGFEAYCRHVRQTYAQTHARCELVCCSVTGPNTITALWRLSGVSLASSPDPPSVIQSVYTTSSRNGLITKQIDHVAQTMAPPLEALQMRCNWYTCSLQ